MIIIEKQFTARLKIKGVEYDVVDEKLLPAGKLSGRSGYRDYYNRRDEDVDRIPLVVVKEKDGE